MSLLKLRQDTVDNNQSKGFINPNVQQFTGILGRRGRGKSYLLEVILLIYYALGFLVLDLWGAPTFENYCYCIAKKGRNKDGNPFTKRIPVTIFLPETVKRPTEQVDAFNAQFNTKYPLVRLVFLPLATATENSEANQKIFEILQDEMLLAKEQRRIISFNRKAWLNETAMFRTLEIFFRGISKIAYKNFHAVDPDIIKEAKKSNASKNEVIRLKNSHKIVFGAREFGEIAPNRMKGDKSGLSTIVKKAQLELFRLARHESISGVIDYQNASDTESSIRNQIDCWAVKTWNRELAGEQFEWIFNKIEGKRKGIFEQYGYSKESIAFADSIYPKIETLGKKWFYAINSSFVPKLKKVPELSVHHKEPEDNWEQMTGISIEHDMELVKQNTKGSAKKGSKAQDKMLYDEIKQRREPSNGKKKSWMETIIDLAEMQDKGEIESKYDFKSMIDDKKKEGYVSKVYSRLKERYEKTVE